MYTRMYITVHITILYEFRTPRTRSIQHPLAERLLVFTEQYANYDDVVETGD